METVVLILLGFNLSSFAYNVYQKDIEAAEMFTMAIILNILAVALCVP